MHIVLVTQEVDQHDKWQLLIIINRFYSCC